MEPVFQKTYTQFITVEITNKNSVIDIFVVANMQVMEVVYVYVDCSIR